jgi:DeoR/GlpR family transcriptional regulator of sugar metabolism
MLEYNIDQRGESILKDRQKKIMQLVQEKGSAKIAELSQQLAVSEMTIHRDIKPLVERGFIVKTYGGIALTQNGSSAANLVRDQCVYCTRKVEPRLAYRLILHDQTIESACCAHCGLLRFEQLGQQVNQAICQDFLTQMTVSARNAWYVFDSDLDIGCCQPQVLTFGRQEHAIRFAKGFGGTVYPFTAALTYLIDQMLDHSSCCKDMKKDG